MPARWLLLSNLKQIKGVLHAFWETGTEGIYWALQDFEHMTEPSEWQKKHGVDKAWGYEGLNILKTGDWLTIIDPEGKTIWGGLVSIDPSIRSYGRCWVHGMPDNFDKDAWCRIFTDEKHTGILIKQVYENGLSHTRKE
jgi:hypothetical protein